MREIDKIHINKYLVGGNLIEWKGEKSEVYSAIKNDKTEIESQIIVFISLFFFCLIKIKIAIVADITYSINCIHSRGPSSLLSQSNQLIPIKIFPYGKIYTKQ